MPALRDELGAIARMAREGQVAVRTGWDGTTAGIASSPFASLRQFRPYRWRERRRHPVMSPGAAEALARA